MKRCVGMCAVVVLFFATAGWVLAQSDPFAGTWKLNVAKSKYDPDPAPKSQIRTWEPSGSGRQISMDSVDASGAHRTFGYLIKYDGKDNPIAGKILNGADSIAAKRIDANTLEITFKRAGKIIERASFIVSGGGKVVTVTAKGSNANGQPFSNVTVWDKQ